MTKAFGWYARSYEVEIVNSKDPLAQLKASKPSIKDLFEDLLDEIIVFKYQITVKASLIKQKGNGDIESADVYFNSITTTVINFEYDLEVLYRIDNWINEGSGLMIVSVDAKSANISIYSPLSGICYIELKNSMKGLMNI